MKIIIKKSVLIRKISMLILVFLLCFESMAAVVSDSDGPAFVTKEEFENLKDAFDVQIDNYNESIDNKIAGAISSYLAGIKLAARSKVDPVVSNWKKIRWIHGPYMYFTNRKFTEYTTTTGKYTDKTNWQIINPENRRQTSSDGYLWWHDYGYAGYTAFNLTFLLHPYDVPWAWGSGRRVDTSRGPSIYAAMKKEKNGFAVYAKDGGFQAELGHLCYLWARQHGITVSPDPEDLGGVGHSTWLTSNLDNTSLTVTSNALGVKEVANYTINNIEYGNASSTSKTASITSIILQEYNPSLISTDTCNLWSDGTDGYALKTACGYSGYMGDYYTRVGDSKVEDNRWKTETQFTKDMNNFIYGMWGSDVSGEMNVAPPLVVSDFTYIDLSESPNSVTVPFRIANIGICAQQCYSTSGSNYRFGNFQGYKNQPLGNMSLSFPLFYRIKWKDMLSGEFKDNQVALCKGDGLPIIKNAEEEGYIRLKIKYEEKADTDASVVTLTPDNKIKTYFKNKPFNDTKGKYLSGYKDLNGKGTKVTLNGTEWTGKEITVNIPVEKGESVWMRIDPLTSNGIYCAMTGYDCEYITE